MAVLWISALVPKYTPRPIPAKAGISAAAKRREIVRLRRQFAPSAYRFLPSQEWDGGLRRKIKENKEIPAFAGMAALLTH
ncbi:MAG: hypothetical protein ACR2QC_08430 [Gammaproteobacteria bacterium]